MKKISATKCWALVFGGFLGLCIWKFGNPVILDHIISAPQSLPELVDEAWPLRWANWLMLPLVLGGIFCLFRSEVFQMQPRWLWLLPLVWLGWQFAAATRTVDEVLTAATLWQFSGCALCYFFGALLMARPTAESSQANRLKFLMAGILVAFAFCLVRAVNQHCFEFPASYEALKEGEQCGWTNFPPESVVAMRHDGMIIVTNGAEAANPLILEKFRKGRVAGTLVYPNALAGLILLLFPVSVSLVIAGTTRLKRPIRFAAIALTVFLGLGAFYWTGSKLGWLVGLGMAGIWLLGLNWPRRTKAIVIGTAIILGLGIFAIRFHSYFAAGATSASARADYWRAAVKTAQANLLFGSGPGTFQRPYAAIKSPTSEMARLTHNDYLEQFCDSGMVGGLAYCVWLSLALIVIGKKAMQAKSKSIWYAAFLGVLGWLAQGIGEFGLYIPAVAWTAFTLLGALVWSEPNEFDKKHLNH